MLCFHPDSQGSVTSAVYQSSENSHFRFHDDAIESGGKGNTVSNLYNVFIHKTTTELYCNQIRNQLSIRFVKFGSRLRNAEIQLSKLKSVSSDLNTGAHCPVKKNTYLKFVITWCRVIQLKSHNYIF